MKYYLHHIKTDEVVDTVDLAREVGLSGARTHFRLRKDLLQKEFDEIWTVKVHGPQDNWWTEDRIISDESLKF